MVAVKVKPATVTELPEAKPLKVTAAFSVVALVASVVVTVGAVLAADKERSVTLFEEAAVNVTVVEEAAPLLHPVKVPVKLPVAPPLE